MPNSIFIIFEIEKNSRTKRETIAESPAKIPNAFQEPRILSVFPPKIPSDKVSGINKRKAWNTNTTAVDAIIPQKTIFAFFAFFKTTEETSIKRKPASIK